MNFSNHLCYLSFIILENSFKKKYNENFLNNKYNLNTSLFITWKKKNKLRGCIGTFLILPLIEGIKKFSLLSAFNDSRFYPIKKSEINKLTCEISILYNFEKINNPFDWIIGENGLKFNLEGYKSTFLPEIPKEQNWDKNQTLFQLALKAGYPYPLNKINFSKIILEKYLSKKIISNYNEFEFFLLNSNL